MKKVPLLSCLFLCSISFIATTNSLDVSSSKCHDSQKSLLLQLKDTLTVDYNRSDDEWNVYLRPPPFPREARLDDWNQSSDCCSWLGVTCNKEGFVTELDLSNEAITSGLDSSTSLFDLQHLKKLDLSFNYFNSTLPPRIGDLTRLAELKLVSAGFFGRIPTDVGQLTSLVSIDLSGNYFTSPVPSFNLSKSLSRLVLSFNALTGEIPSHLFSIPSLEILVLSNNRFSGEFSEFEPIAVSMLDTLDLSQNNLQGTLPKSIFELENLTTIDLSYNNFSGTIDLLVFQPLMKLEYLDLSYNVWSVNADGSDSFPLIQTLKLASCKLTSFPNLNNLTQLYHLDLSKNQISGEFPSWIWNVGYIKSLNLSHNFLESSQEPLSLPDSLDSLDLNHNRLSGKIPVLPPELDYLDLSSNNFDSIRTDVFNRLRLNRIGFVSLANNSFAGILPESFCNNTNHGVLDLSDNNFSGTIPSCIAQVYGVSILNALVLRNNNFSGPIPDDLFPVWSPLKVLDLNGNSIQGEIPKSLLNCSTLEILDLGHNYLRSKFPCLLKNISTLQAIILRSNEFYGEIECEIESDESWSKLQILDLAHNRFGGELPSGLFSKFREMKAFNGGVRANVLGFIVYDDRYVFHSYLNSPDIFYRYTVTVTIKGHEREVPRILTIFTCIDLSNNDFHGTIPLELFDLQALYMLDLSNNALTGEIPPSIGNVRRLESLDVSRNNLTGTIPESLGELNFLQFLNLSYNKLSGEIPKGRQIQTFLEDSFTGNEGLCGAPSKKICPGDDEESSGTLFPDVAKEGNTDSGSKIELSLLSAGIGFSVGLGLAATSLVLLPGWRELYFKRIDGIAAAILRIRAS